MKRTGEFASRQIRPSHVTTVWGLHSLMTNPQAVLHVFSVVLGEYRAGGHAMLVPHTWKVLSHGTYSLCTFYLIVLRSVSKQRQRSRKHTRLLLIGRTWTRSLGCFFQVVWVCHCSDGQNRRIGRRGRRTRELGVSKIRSEHMDVFESCCVQRSKPHAKLFGSSN